MNGEYDAIKIGPFKTSATEFSASQLFLAYKFKNTGSHKVYTWDGVSIFDKIAEISDPVSG